MLDIIPSNFGLYSLEVNTNSAFDDDLVEWTDFKRLCRVISNWEYIVIGILAIDKAVALTPSTWDDLIWTSIKKAIFKMVGK